MRSFWKFCLEPGFYLLLAAFVVVDLAAWLWGKFQQRHKAK